MPAVSVPPPSPASPTSPNGTNGKKGLSSAAARATGLTIGLVLLSRVLGVVRDMVLTSQFGQNNDTTIFTAAFRVPDLIALVIAGGALSSVFVPVFTEYWNEGKEEDSWKVFGSITSIAAAVVAALVILLELAAKPLTQLLNPEFESAYFIDNTTSLSRILLPAQWFLLVGGLIMGTLYARKRFLVPGLAPLLYNLGQIVGGIIGGILRPNSIEGLAFMAWGATVGAFCGKHRPALLGFVAYPSPISVLAGHIPPRCPPCRRLDGPGPARAVARTAQYLDDGLFHRRGSPPFRIPYRL
jgi:putative peptidoglycan lipid II flippase